MKRPSRSRMMMCLATTIKLHFIISKIIIMLSRHLGGWPGYGWSCFKHIIDFQGGKYFENIFECCLFILKTLSDHSMTNMSFWCYFNIWLSKWCMMTIAECGDQSSVFCFIILFFQLLDFQVFKFLFTSFGKMWLLMLLLIKKVCHCK